MRSKLTLCLVSTSLLVPAFAHAAPKLKNDKDKVSYAIGHRIGSDFKEQQIDKEINVDSLVAGLREGLEGKKSELSPEESQKLMMNLQTSLRAKQEAKSKELADKGKTFLAENKKKPGVVTLPSGLQYKVLKDGNGPKPTANDVVTVNYRGTLVDGTEFDSSYKRGEPATFPVGGVIKGWTEGLQLMKTGSKYQFFIPPELAYGERGAGPQIGPNATLIFEVELLSIQPQAAASPSASKTAPAATKTGTPKK